MESIKVGAKYRDRGTFTLTDDYRVTSRKLSGHARWEFTVTDPEGDLALQVVTSRTMAIGMGLIDR